MYAFSLSRLQLMHILSLVLAASVSASSSIVTRKHHSSSICEQIDAQLPGRVSYPGSTGYNASQTAYYADDERDLTPGCVFRPNDTNDVSEFVKLVGDGRGGRRPHRKGSKKDCRGPKFAVRAGGHALWAGAANMDGGVTVDLRSLNSVVISEDGLMASVGGGATYSGEVYPKTVKHNLTVMGGRVPGIGVGGFTLGGGLGFLGRKHGWACDNVYGYEVVLASGDVVHATATSHPDLWLALKGGSSNFGIVTRFDLATFPQDLMWGGVLPFGYSQDVLDAHAEAFSDFMRPENFDENAEMSVILGFTNVGGKPVHSVADALFYSEGVEFPGVYDNFTKNMDGVLTTDGLVLDNVENLVNGFGEALPPTVDRIYQLVYSFKTSDAAFFKQLMASWQKWTDTVAEVEGLNTQFLLQPQAVSNGTNVFGLTPGAKDEVIATITAVYVNPADEKVVERRVQAFLTEQVKIIKENDLFLEFQYLNYADKSQDPIGSYGREAVRKLRDVSKKYDPDGLFQRGISGAFRVLG